jgi:hypothetical protein
MTAVPWVPKDAPLANCAAAVTGMCSDESGETAGITALTVVVHDAVQAVASRYRAVLLFCYPNYEG